MELLLNEKIEYVENLILTIKRNIFQYEMVVRQYEEKASKGEVNKDHAQNMAKFQAQLNFNKGEFAFYSRELETLKSQVTPE